MAEHERGAPTPSTGLTELIGRALTDQEFREALGRDRAKVAKEYKLSKSDTEALERISQEELEEQAVQFGSGNAAAMAVKVVIKVKF